MKTVEERLKSYEPLWENWTYTGEFLGEGAMSSVFEIQSNAMGIKEIAALKIITVKKDMHGEVIIPENALNEIKILRDLSGCPNIVNYHDSTQRKIYDKDNNLCEIDILIKMEKLTPLSEGDKLNEEEIIKLGKNICSALIHASEHGIIHRDIKPQNIFVDKEGTYKLGDFGIAKIVSDLSSHYTMNIGTLAYSAPEIQYNPIGKYDISSDVYSLGLVLYVFLNNGYLPFHNSSSSLRDAISKRLSKATFPSPANGSKNLKSIVMRACSHDISKRYSTPQEMLEDLELLSTGGKKLVVDPFSTLDANIDIIEPELSSHASSESVADGVLKISKKSSKVMEKSPESTTMSGSGLKISSMSSASTHEMTDKPSDDETKLKISTKRTSSPSIHSSVSDDELLSDKKIPPVEPDLKTSETMTTSRSGLKINMKTSVPKTTTPPIDTPKPKEPGEKRTKSPFFTNQEL